QIQEIGPGKRVASVFASCGSTDSHQPLLVRDRRIGSEQDALNPTEDGGVCADAQRQAKNRQDGKSGTASENAQAEANVLQEIVDYVHLAGVATFLLCLLDT